MKLDTECIISLRKTNEYGYVTYPKYFNGKFSKIYEYEEVWIAVHGEIPVGENIYHKCKVRNCINVEHMFMATNPMVLMTNNWIRNWERLEKGE